jgi:hypothetical protein
LALPILTNGNFQITSKAILFVSRDGEAQKTREYCESRGYGYEVIDCYYEPAKSSSIPLFDVLSIKQKEPFPVLVAKHWGFHLATAQHPTSPNQLVYCINDWVTGLINGCDSRGLISMMVRKKDNLYLTNLRVIRSDGKQYFRRFTDDMGIYLISQNLRTTAKYPKIGEVKTYIARVASQADAVRTSYPIARENDIGSD